VENRQWRDWKSRQTSTTYECRASSTKLRKENLIIELKEMEIAERKGLLIEKSKVEEGQYQEDLAVKNALVGIWGPRLLQR